MPQGDEVMTEPVEKAVARLLRASMDFTRAYQAWAKSPVFEHLGDLDRAEKSLTAAEHEVALAQQRTTKK